MLRLCKGLAGMPYSIVTYDALKAVYPCLRTNDNTMLVANNVRDPPQNTVFSPTMSVLTSAYSPLDV